MGSHRKLALLCLALLASAPSLRADLRLAAVFGDHMVLQRSSSVRLWGWAEPGELIRIRPSWYEQDAAVTADPQGAFEVTIRTPADPGPHTLRFRGKSEVLLRDCLLGEVWLASGQSNMEMPVGHQHAAYSGVRDWEAELKDAERPRIRFFEVENAISPGPASDVRGSWVPATAESVRGFSATAWFFAKRLERELDVPVGIVAADWGGSPAEAWTSARALAGFPQYDEVLASWARLAAGSAPPDAPGIGMHTPSALFNGMIAPLERFELAGALWYQGESNVGRAEEYARLFPALIRDWRASFRRELPFLFVQIAPFAYRGDPEAAPLLRQAQADALFLPATGMVVTLDIGDAADIHPKEKQAVGSRLAALALHRVYGKRHVPCEAPAPLAARRSGSRVEIEFDAEDELEASAGSAFELAGSDGVFFPAAQVVGAHAVVLDSPGVPEPLRVRYAWSAVPAAWLVGRRSRLPVGPFTLDLP